MWQLITQTPETFKGGQIWSVIVNINSALTGIGYGLLVLFFAIGIFSSAASFKELQRPEFALRHFIRFVLAKVAVGRVGPGEKGAPFSVKGRCRTTGLPREIALTAGETAEALAPVAAELLRGVLEVLERAPGSLAADAAAEGILLTGGGCQLRGLDAFLAEGTGLPIRRAEDPETTVVLGLEQALDTLSRRQEGVLDLARRRAVAGEV